MHDCKSLTIQEFKSNSALFILFIFFIYDDMITYNICKSAIDYAVALLASGSHKS